MALRTILKKQEEVLHKKCKEVTDFNSRLFDLLDDLRDTVTEANGLGLAAPQVGIMRRVAVIVDDKGNITELINPTITKSEGEVELAEGCLSCPGEVGFVKRPQKITISAFARDGKPFELTLEDMTARAACHEIDHLDGILFIDRSDNVMTEQEFDEYCEQNEDEEYD